MEIIELCIIIIYCYVSFHTVQTRELTLASCLVSYVSWEQILMFNYLRQICTHIFKDATGVHNAKATSIYYQNKGEIYTHL